MNNLNDNAIDALPALLLAAIREKTWLTPDAAALRPLIFLVNQAADAGLPTIDLLVVLAVATRHALPIPNTDWTPAMHELDALVRPFLASSIGLRDTIAQAYGDYPTLEQAIDVASRFVADERAKLAMPEGQADTVIQVEVARVAALYPALNLSFGYVGNLWSGPFRDDRSFKIFTTLATLDCFGGCNISFGNHTVDELGELAHIITHRFQAWAAATNDRLMQGKLRQVRLAS